MMKTKKLQRLLNSILENPAAEPFQPSAAAVKSVSITEINPVPITAEWLYEVCIGGEQIAKRLNFIQWLPKECNCIITIYSKPGDVFLIALYSIDDNISYFKGEIIVQYRHELQNFFRMHTGKDLI